MEGRLIGYRERASAGVFRQLPFRPSQYGIGASINSGGVTSSSADK